MCSRSHQKTGGEPPGREHEGERPRRHRRRAHAGSARKAKKAEKEPVAHRRRRDAGRYARLFRFSADRLCCRFHRQGLEPDLRRVGCDPVRFGGRRTALVAAILNVSIATGAMALTPHGAWIFLAVCRLFVGFGTTGLYSVDITFMQEFTGSRNRGWITGLTTTMLPAGFLLGALLGAFATPYIGWRGLFAVGLLPALLVLYVRAFVAALAGAPRPPRGSTPVVGLGADGRSENDTAADGPAAGREDSVDRAVPLPAQHHRRLSDRPDADRRCRPGIVASDAARHGPQHHAAGGLQTGHLGQRLGDRGPLLLLVDLRCVGTPRFRHFQLPDEIGRAHVWSPV